MKRFEGVFVVMMTCYDEAGGIDRDAMAHMTGHLVERGVHGLVVLGSNGECPYLTHDLQKKAIDAVVEAADGAVPVIVGINERGTEPALAMATFAREAGADGMLVALPAFYPLREESVREHYESVCGVGLPVLYYNFPTHTGLELSPESIASLAGIENLVGAKETIFDIAEIGALAAAAGEDFSVLTGTTLNMVASMEVGACGAICPLPNVVPEKAVALYEAVRAGDRELADRLQGEIFACAPLLATSPTPHAMLKEALRIQGHPVRVSVKRPLPPLTGEQAETVKKTLEQA